MQSKNNKPLKLSREAKEFYKKHHDRVSPGEQRSVQLINGKNPAYHYRIVSERNLYKYRDQYKYEMANSTNSPGLVFGDAGGVSPNNTSTGSGFTQVVDHISGRIDYLMCIPKDVWLLDQKIKNKKRNSDLDASLASVQVDVGDGEVVELDSNIRDVLLAQDHEDEQE